MHIYLLQVVYSSIFFGDGGRILFGEAVLYSIYCTSKFFLKFLLHHFINLYCLVSLYLPSGVVGFTRFCDADRFDLILFFQCMHVFLWYMPCFFPICHIFVRYMSCFYAKLARIIRTPCRTCRHTNCQYFIKVYNNLSFYEILPVGRFAKAPMIK